MVTNNALTVLQRRYLLKDASGKITETPIGLFKRVARAIGSIEYEYKKDPAPIIDAFYNIMEKGDFLPNSPTLMNAGTKCGQLSACFVLPIEDSMRGIFNTLRDAALVQKTGGGTGFSFSELRPKNDMVNTTKGVSSGPVSFMHIYDAATESIKQGGKRRGASIAVLRVDHPDIMEFIDCKKEEGKIGNFNISVAITDNFMDALKKGGQYSLLNPRSKKEIQKLYAKDVFDRIVENSWLNGEPGVLFIDRINKYNPIPSSPIEATNPCGEIPLAAYESCNLGSINLSNFYKEGKIDWERLKMTARLATRFLDNVIDANIFPLEEIKEKTLASRKIGLGVMGWSDLLFKLGISYASNEAVTLAEKIMKTIREEGIKESELLAKERGTYPLFKKSIYKNDTPRRNSTITTVAPTGTISIIANTSGGIEPAFALAFERHNVLGGTKLDTEVNNIFKEYAEKEGVWSDAFLKKLINSNGCIGGMEEIPKKIRDTFITSKEISPQWHIKMQAAFQKYTDNSVSKTINLPNNATKKDVESAILGIYEAGCKGMTVYRDGSRAKQVLVSGKKKEGIKTTRGPRKRPSITNGSTLLIHTGCGRMYVTINEDAKGICEVFTQLGKSGGCTSSQAEAIGRLISLALRSGVDTSEIIDQVQNIRCPSPVMCEGGSILSCSDGIAKALKRYIENKDNPSLFEGKMYNNDLHGNGSCPECPDCGNILVMQEGCVVCQNCGYSKCE